MGVAWGRREVGSCRRPKFLSGSAVQGSGLDASWHLYLPETSFLELLRSVRGSEGNPVRQATPTRGENRHLGSGLWPDPRLIEPFLEVPNADEFGHCHRGLDTICARDDEEAPLRNMVERSNVNNRANFGRRLADSGPKFLESWAEVGRAWPHSAKHRSGSGQIWPMLGQIGRIRPAWSHMIERDGIRSVSAPLGPNSTLGAFDRMRPHSGKHRLASQACAWHSSRNAHRVTQRSCAAGGVGGKSL